MNTSSKEFKLLKQLLVINKEMTVGQASHRLKILRSFLAQKEANKCS